ASPNWPAVRSIGLVALLVTASGCYLLPSTQQRDSQWHWGNSTNVVLEDDAAPPGVVRQLIGGHARNDECGVIAWSCSQACERGAKAFIFLGDMMITPERDVSFSTKPLNACGIPFYPIIGNHEVEQFGVWRAPWLNSLLGYNPERQFQRLFLGG